MAGAFAALPSSATAQAFGGALLIANGHILVGEAAHEREPGTVWVFARDGDGWSSVAALRDPAPHTGDGFGKALARAGDFVFVGAGGTDGGAIYYFPLADPSGWNADREAALSVSHGEIGSVLAGSRTVLMASMSGEQDGRLWAEMVTVLEDDVLFDVSLDSGIDVPLGGSNPYALTDNLLVVGDPNGNTVHLHERRASDGDWESTGTLTPPGDPEQRTLFGSAVAVAGDEILVAQMLAGVVHRYAKMDGAWQPVGTLEPENDEMRLGYGASLAVDGEALLVGGAQRFHEYRRSGDGWERTGASPPYNADGAPVARAAGLYLDDEVAVLADPSADFGLGAATVFSRESGDWVQTGRLVADHEPLPAISGGEVTCEDGEAAGYDCNEVDLLAFVPWEELGAARGARLNDIWGWTDPETEREYAIVCHMDGTSFVDVTDPFNPRYLGHLPKTEGSRASTWRDAKVYRNHAYIVADGAGEHGMQVFDLTRLRDVTEPQVFDADALYTEIASSHNVAINETTGFAYLVGSPGT
ncbi:MAG: choice-of-anchor B family protein [Gemmatimonadetes bacterium]|nr:choice-of-anchor B family protein [Gemmatimonadota bacterium]